MNKSSPLRLLGDCVGEDAPICYGILKPGPEYPGGVPVVKVKNYSRGELALDGLIHTSPTIDAQYERSRLQEGDIVVAIRGSTGDVAIIPPDLDGSNITQDSARIRPASLEDRDYLYLAIKSPEAQRYIKLHTVGQAVKGINIGELRKLPLYWPAADERTRIAELLMKWKVAIDLQQRLLEAAERRRLSIANEALIGKRRFPKFIHSKRMISNPWGGIPEDWKYPRIGDVALGVSLKNPEGRNLPVLSCTKHQGLVDSLSYFGKRVFSQNLSNYRLVKRGQFAYATNHIEEGSIGYQDLYDEALVSPIYTVFETSDEIEDRFLFLVLKTELYRHIFEVNTSSSVDRRGSLRWSEFAKIHVPLPSLEEQRKIVALFDLLDEEIALLRRSLDLLKKQKTALMQQLLTGRLRVKPKRRRGGRKAVAS